MVRMDTVSDCKHGVKKIDVLQCLGGGNSLRLVFLEQKF